MNRNQNIFRRTLPAIGLLVLGVFSTYWFTSSQAATSIDTVANGDGPGPPVPTPTPSPLLTPSPTVSPTPICAPGALDFSFNGFGYVKTHLGGDDRAYTIAVQSDGKIVAAGERWSGNVTDFALVRYNPNGVLDTSFGVGGRVITQVSINLDRINAIAITPEGKIVVAGYAVVGPNFNFALARYNPDGSLDSSFGTAGIVTTRVGNNSVDRGEAVVLQPDGKIIAAGSVGGSFALVRYNVNGSLDGSFGLNGKAITQVGAGSGAKGLVLQTDGRVLAIGSAAAGKVSDLALVRYTANGSLDNSFGVDGKVITQFGVDNDRGESVTVQADGKILVAGFTRSLENDFAIARYESDGTLDTMFGVDGKIITPIGQGDDYAESVWVEPDGRIIASGSGAGSPIGNTFALARYHPDGTLDTSFGDGGKVLVQVGFHYAIGYAAARQNDGSILVAGEALVGNLNSDFLVARYLPTASCVTPTPTPTPTLTPTPTATPTPNCSGMLDTSFDGDGKVTTAVQNALDEAKGMAVQADGKVVVVGRSAGSPTTHFATVRYNRDGSLDTTFDGDGKVLTQIVPGVSSTAYAVAIQQDGKIVVAGDTFGSGYDFAVVRYNPDGSLDTTFDGEGKLTVNISSFEERAHAVAMDPNGRIVVAGLSHNGSDFDFAVLRIDPNGALDTTFSGDGIVLTNIATSDIAYSVAVQPDGMIVVGGTTYNFTNYDFAVVRYRTNGTRDNSFDGNGIATTPVLNDNDYAQTIAMQPDGKIVLGGYAQNPFASRHEFALVRYNANGSLDTLFHHDGKVTTSLLGRDDRVHSIAVQQDGKIIAAGYGANGSDDDFAIARYGADGTLDETFGGGGIVTTGFFGSDHVNSVVVTPNKKIVAAGYAINPSTGYDFAVAQYLASDCLTDRRTQFDHDGDGKADFSVFRPANGTWYIQKSMDGYQGAVPFGNDTDRLTPADFDGDGQTDIAVFRPTESRWFILRSSTGTVDYPPLFGAAEDLPVPADYDGDGRADLTVFRPSQGTWYRKNSANGLMFAIQFGLSGDVPTVGDFDGDGESDIGIWRPSNGDWYNLRSSDGSVFGERFGQTGDRIAPADYDGDGKTDIAIFRPSTGQWVVRNSATATYSFSVFGAVNDVPVAGDYDGDGKADIAVWRPENGTWYVQRSSDGEFIVFPWGQNGDVPTPAAFGN